MEGRDETKPFVWCGPTRQDGGSGRNLFFSLAATIGRSWIVSSRLVRLHARLQDAGARPAQLTPSRQGRARRIYGRSSARSGGPVPNFRENFEQDRCVCLVGAAGTDR